MPLRDLTRLVCCLFCALTWSARAQTPVRVGGEFQVNSYTTSDQSGPAVSVDADGNFVAVWYSYGSAGTDTDSTSIQARRFAADGTPLSADFQVNTYTTTGQYLPDVGVEPDGDFVVVWFGRSGIDDPYFAVSGRRFASDGSPLGDEFRVNSYTSGQQEYPAVAVDADGDFIVVWSSFGSPGDDPGFSVQGQRYGADGLPSGDQFQVNTVTTGDQNRPDVAMSPDGDFVVVWHSARSAGDDYFRSVQGQRYAADGTPLGGQFQVNTATLGTQDRPAVAADGSGDFVIVWESEDFTPDIDLAIKGQRYASDGTPLGAEFQVDSLTEGLQVRPDVTTDTAGNFAVVWLSMQLDGQGFFESIQGQLLAVDGTPRGDEFQINTYSGELVADPMVGLSEDGRFVVVWDGYALGGPDTSSSSVQGQRFDSPLFSDGFESGDVTAWPESVGLP
jgi:hypothetical protein